MKLKGKKGEFYFHSTCGWLGYGDGRVVEAGTTYEMFRWGQSARNTNPKLCSVGMHGCKYLDGLRKWGLHYEQLYLCVVQLIGDVRHGNKGSKSVARKRKVVAMRTLTDKDRLYLLYTNGLRSEDVARWVMNSKRSLPKPRP